MKKSDKDSSWIQLFCSVIRHGGEVPLLSHTKHAEMKKKYKLKKQREHQQKVTRILATNNDVKNRIYQWGNLNSDESNNKIFNDIVQIQMNTNNDNSGSHDSDRLFFKIKEG